MCCGQCDDPMGWITHRYIERWGCTYKHDYSAVGLGLAGASLHWSSGKMITSQAAKGHDNVLTVWYYKPISLNEDLSWLFYVDSLRDKFRPVSITLFLSLSEKTTVNPE